MDINAIIDQIMAFLESIIPADILAMLTDAFDAIVEFITGLLPA